MNSLVRRHFGRRAAGYEAQALLQRAVACRLGRLCRDLPLPAGPRADLGAGSGLLSRALPAQGLLQLDLCPELLQRNPQQPQLVWDLNAGLPTALQGAALLVSGFALQWLDDPVGQLGHWCRALAPGGWLALAVPTAGSFPQWRRAADAADVACTALELPAADRLLHAAIASELHPPPQPGAALQPAAPGGAGRPAPPAAPRRRRQPAPPPDGRGAAPAPGPLAPGHAPHLGGVAAGRPARAHQRPCPMSTPLQLVVCGTDTDVGKTVVSALLVQGLGAHYWKPVQSGLEGGGDTGRVQQLLELPAERLWPEAYRLTAPVSPHWAAERDGLSIDPARLALPAWDGPLVVETAGGLLVPLRRNWLQIEQIAVWGLPVLLVARSGLGTLNHTLLSLEALSRRSIPVLGLVLNGDPHPDNPRTLAALGGVPVLAELPRLDPLDREGLERQWQRSGLARSLQP